MKKIIISLAIIAGVGAMAAGITTAFFSDTETSTGNTFTAGTIDISVDGKNPWQASWQNELDKPCQTNYMTFRIKNEGKNPAKVWKRLTGITTNGGDATYCGASSEPEYVEGGGQFNGDGTCNGTDYTERKNLSAFMIYDMAVCVKAGNNDCAMVGVEGTQNQTKPDPNGTGWQVLIDGKDQVRVDNVADSWVELIGSLEPEKELVVSQSYHLMTWTNSGQPMVTNWAQGDVMTFNVELEARQTDAPAPGTTQNGVVEATALLVNKNTTTWEEEPSEGQGTLTYKVEGATFSYDFSASNLVDGNYQLIYYPDPWLSPKTIVKIGNTMTVAGNSVTTSGNVDLGIDLPNSDDANYPVGAKIWLVPITSLNSDQLSWTNLDKFLFDKTLVKYDDTDVD